MLWGGPHFARLLDGNPSLWQEAWQGLFIAIYFLFPPPQVCVLGLHLAKELCEVDEDGDSWLHVMRSLPLLPTLCTTLEVSLRLKQNLHFTEASLHLLLTLAKTQQVSRGSI